MLWAKDKIVKSELGNSKLNALSLICDNAARNISMDGKLGVWAILYIGLGENDEFDDEVVKEVAKIWISFPSNQKLMLKFEILPALLGNNCNVRSFWMD